MSNAVSTEQIIEVISAEGLDYHDFRCDRIAEWVSHAPEALWHAVASWARDHCSRADYAKAWRLAGEAGIPDDLDEAA